MSTTTTKGIVPEEPLVYADLSQQFVPFEESDESVTPPITIEQNRPDEHSKNVNGNDSEIKMKFIFRFFASSHEIFVNTIAF